METATSLAKRIELKPLVSESRSRGMDKLVIRTADFIEIISLSEIVYIEADGNYSTFVLGDGTQLMTSRTIGSYSNILGESAFIRPHQSYLVNTGRIKRIRKIPYYAICMEDGKEIPVSRARRTDIVSTLTAQFLG